MESMGLPQNAVDDFDDLFRWNFADAPHNGLKEESDIFSQAGLLLGQGSQSVVQGVHQLLLMDGPDHEFPGISTGGRFGTGLLDQRGEMGRIHPETNNVG
jgi:hypothetical protein